MRKKVDSRIRTLVENGVKLNERTLFVVVGDREQVNELGAIRERCRELEYRCDARAFSFLSSRANDDDQSRSSTSSSTLTDRGPPRVVRLGRAEEIATASRRESELAKEALLKTQKAKGDELKALRIAHKKEIDQLIETFERRRSGDVGDMLRGDAAGTGTGTGTGGRTAPGREGGGERERASERGSRTIAREVRSRCSARAMQ